MRSVFVRMVVLALICFSGFGCGSDAPTTSLNPVHGKVSYKGEPAAGAIVSLQAEGPAPQTTQGNPLVPIGVAGDDGVFTIACEGHGLGAPAGKYKVLIVWRPAGNTKAAKLLPTKKRRSANDPNALMPADPFDGRYSNPAKPVFSAEVKPGPNELSFDLKD